MKKSTKTRFRKRKFILCFLFMCCIVFPKSILKAQNLKIVDYSNKNEVNTMVRDGSTMWIGTSSGLYQRDLHGSILYAMSMSDGLADDYITSLFVDRDSNLWIGTRNGVSLFDRDVALTFADTMGIGQAWINDFGQDSEGNVYAATYSGLYKYDGLAWENLKNYPVVDSSVQFPNAVWISSGSGFEHLSVYRDIAIDKQDNIWAINHGFLMRFDGAQWIVYGMGVDKIDLRKDGTLIGTGPMGWCEFDGNNLHFANQGPYFYNFILDKNENILAPDLNWIFLYDGDYQHNLVDAERTKCLAFDAVDSLWIGSAFGLIKYGGNIKDTIPRFNCIDNNSIKAIHVDDSGRVWVGKNNGISMFDGMSWINFDETKGPVYKDGGITSHNMVCNITEDKNGNIWVSCTAGLLKYTGDGWEKLDCPDYYLYWVEFDSNNNLYALSGSRDLIKYDGNNWYRYGISVNGPRSLAIDQNGNVLVVCDMGVLFFDGTSMSKFMMPDGSKLSDANKIVFDQAGNMWILTNQGLVKVTGSNWVEYLKGTPANQIAFADSGVVWISTNTGLSKFDGANWVHYSQKDGLKTKSASSLAMDGKNVWIGTEYGVYKAEEYYIQLKLQPAIQDIKTSFAAAQKLKNQNKTVDFSINVNSFKNISGFQFSVHFNNKVLDLNNIHNFSLPGLSQHNFDFGLETQGIITVQFDHSNLYAYSLPDNANLFNLNFKIIDKIAENEGITIDGNPMEVKFTNRFGKELMHEKESIGLTLGLEKIKPNVPIRIYPNPACDILNIQGEGLFSEIKICNLQGVVIKEFTNINSGMLDIGDLQPGVYIIKGNSQSHGTFYQKFKKANR